MSVCGHLDEVRRCAPSVVAVVAHATSDQALRQPEQTDETSRDDQQRQGSSRESHNKNYSACDRAILGLLTSQGVC